MQKILIPLALGIASLHAADFHVSPAGAGTQDGSTPQNAAPGVSASSIFNDKMNAGDRLLFAAGTYEGINLALNNGGSATQPKIIEGTEGTVFSSSWTIDKPEKGPTAVTFGPGVSGVTLRNLTIKNYCFSLRAGVSKETPRTNIVLDGIRMEQMRHGIYFSDCDQMTISNCTMKRYSKHGFRFDQGCDKVTVKNCIADCSEGDLDWETKTELFPFGFNLNDGGAPNTGFVFEDCVAKNNMKSNQGTLKYTNGDGFVAEGNSSDVIYRRCHSLRNQDGGFDIKVDAVKFIDCVAIGHRRDFRIWKTATLENCFAGWSQTGFWTHGGPITATNCTFYGHKKSEVEIEEKTTGVVTFNKCLLAAGEELPKLGIVLGKADLTDSTVLKPGEDPKFVKADPKWDGTGNTMDSTAYPDKGYSSKRVSRTK